MARSILPTLKEKKRYVVYEIISEKTFNNPVSEVMKNIESIMGLFDSASFGVQAIDYDSNKQRGVLRVATKGLDKLKMSLALMSQLEEEDVNVRTVGVSGILKKAKDRYMAS